MIKGKFLLSYLDYYVYCVSVFIGLFILAFALINEESKKGNIIDPSQYIIELTWEDNSNSDIDLWVQDPTGAITYFAHKDSQIVTLDRDDLGINNTVTLQDGTTITNPLRREIANIRRIIPGTFTVNVMCYNNRNGDPVKAHVTIRRLNPYSEVTDKVVEVVANGDEETILNFDMDDRGNISNTNDTYTPLFSVVKP
jgi:hypothetical protein